MAENNFKATAQQYTRIYIILIIGEYGGHGGYEGSDDNFDSE